MKKFKHTSGVGDGTSKHTLSGIHRRGFDLGGGGGGGGTCCSAGNSNEALAHS